MLRERPDTDLSPALAGGEGRRGADRAGRRSEFEQVRAELADRYRDEKVTIAGRTGTAAEMLRRLLAEDEKAAATSGSAAHADTPGPDLAREVDPAWQLRIADSIEAGMTPLELNQWQSNTLSLAVPAVAVDGPKLYVNYLGHIMALDLETARCSGAPRRSTTSRCWPCSRWARCSTRAGSRSSPPASTSGRWAATSRTRT